MDEAEEGPAKVVKQATPAKEAATPAVAGVVALRVCGRNIMVATMRMMEMLYDEIPPLLDYGVFRLSSPVTVLETPATIFDEDNLSPPLRVHHTG